MKKLSKKMKQLLTFMLTIAMIVTTVPQTGMQVMAAGTEAEVTSTVQEASEEDTVTEPSDGTEEENDSDKETEEPADSNDENQKGGGLTDDEANTDEDPSDGSRNPSDSDTDPSNPDNESSDDAIEDGGADNEETDEEENPEDEQTLNDEADDSVADEAEEDEVVEGEYDITSDEGISQLADDDGFEINDGVLEKYTGSATEVEIPDSVTSIKASAFINNTTIQKVTFSENITEIGNSAFSGCTALKTVVLNSKLETIGTYAFQNVPFGAKTGVNTIETGSLTIPGTVTSIGNLAFNSCTYLGEVVFENGSNNELTMGTQVFYSCSNLKKVVLPDRLEEIKASTFNKCISLEEVTFGTDLKAIGNSAFNGCSSLTSVTFPAGLETIGTYAFQDVPFGAKAGVDKIETGSLTIPSTVTSIDYMAFYSCTYLGEVIFENGSNNELTMEHEVFYNCANLKKVVLPDRLVAIKDSTFNKCISLEEVTFGTGLKTIGNSAFNGCSSLTSVAFPAGLETIGNYVFQDVPFGAKTGVNTIETGSLTIPGTVTSIGRMAFYSCTYLGEVVFENGSSNELAMENQVFGYCPNLKRAVLPDRLEEINDGTFIQCTSLEKVTFGTGLKAIGNSAFNECSSLTSVAFPAGLETIGAYAFQKVPLGEKTNTGVLVIPSTVTSIGMSAFESCAYLGEVTFENGNVYELTIGSSVFRNCDNLKQVLLPDRLTDLNIAIFYNCKSLNALYIPATTKNITGSYNKTYYPKLVIYGETGSAAEDFAKKNNIPFKSKGELDIYVKSISLSPKEIKRAYLTDEELTNGGVTIQLNVDVKPSTAQNKAVSYQSSNDNVATVSDTGVVTLTGFGEATIKVIAEDTTNEVAPAECKVSVLHKWTEEEKEAARAKLYELNQGSSLKFILIANLYTNLREDFGFNTSSEDFTAEWRLPYAVQPGENSIYDVILHRDDYEDAILEDMTITGIQIDGITIDGSSTRSVQEGKDIILTSEISYSGYSGEETVPAPDSILDYDMIWESAKTANVTVNPVGETKAGDAQLTGVKQSRGTVVTAKLILKKNGEQIAPTNANKGITWFSAQVKVDVIGGVVVDGIKISVTDDAQLTEDISSKGKLIQEDVPKETTYNLTATVSAGDKPVDADDCPLTWTSSDTKVVQVKAGEGGSAVLTVKAETGSATISVSAAKNGGFSTSFKMTLRDSTPRLENANVTLNLYSDKPESIITIRPSDGHLIQENGLRLLDGNASTDIVSTFFNIEKVENSDIEYRIGVKSKDGLSTGKHKVILEAKTKAADETEADVKRLLLTIQVNSVKPKVTITQTAQTALNLYERNGTGTLKVVANVEISSITFTPNATSGVYLEQKGETTFEKAGLEGSMSYGFANDSTIDSTNYTKANAKGTLTVKFKGFTDDAAYTKSVTLKTNKTLPKFTAAGITLYPNTTPVVADSAPVKITNKTAGKTLTAGDGYTVTPTVVPDNYKITSQTAEQMPIVQALSKDTKGKTIKFDITNAGWRNGIKATVSCSVKIGKEPTLSFSNAKVTLNKDFPLYTVDEYKPVEVRPYITGFEDDLIVTGLEEIKGKDNNSDNILKKGALLLKYEDGVIKVGIKDKDAEEFKKTKKYTYQLTAATSKGLSVKGTLTVTVSTASPSINLKAGGSIDLANRSGSAITYKITTKNYTDDIDSVSLDGVYSGFFELDPPGDDKGVATVRARDGMGLKMKTNYPLTVKVTYASGTVLAKDVKINPKQSSPKFTTDIKKATLFESAPGEIYGQKIVFSGNTETEVKKIELVSGQNAFDFDYSNDGKTGIIYVTDDAYAKTNKTYKLKFAVTLKDAAVNAAPIYVTVQVKYNR